MELFINNKSTHFQTAPAHLKQVIASQLSGATSGIAVALNNQVIPEARWESTRLTSGDQILIITATQGG